MRVLIATGVYPPEIGGPATAMAALAQELRQLGHEVMVLTYGDKREDPDVATIPRGGGIVLRYLRFASLARKLFAACDVVVATDVFSVGIPVRAALIGKSTRFVLRLGGEWAWEDAVEKGRTFMPLKAFWQDPTLAKFRRTATWSYRWILGRANAIAYTSDLLKQIVTQVVPHAEERSVIVWNASSDELYANGAEDMRPHVPLRLAFIGRFAKVKNVPMLARALKAAVHQNPSIECVFAGSGETLPEVRNILHGLSGMYFLGNVPHARLNDIFAESDLVLLPSLSDICPNAIIEALAAGVPCLITSEHGLPKPVSGAMELDPMDEHGWANAILQLAASKNVYNELKYEARPVSFPAGPSMADVVVRSA